MGYVRTNPSSSAIEGRAVREEGPFGVAMESCAVGA